MTITFDPTYNSNFTYSNGNRSAAQTVNTGNWETVRFTLGYLQSGIIKKVYFEISVDVAHNTGVNQYDSWGCGFVNPSGPVHDFPGHANSFGMMADCGNANSDFWYNTIKNLGFGGTCYQPGDRLGVAFNITSGSVGIWVRDITRDGAGTHWWGQNNTGNDDPTTNSGFNAANVFANTTAYGCFAGQFNAAASPKATIYLTADQFLGAIPSGYQPYEIQTPYIIRSSRQYDQDTEDEQYRPLIQVRSARVGLAPSPPPPVPPTPMVGIHRPGSDAWDEYQTMWWRWVRPTHIEEAPGRGLYITKYLGLATVAPQATLSISKLLGLAVTAPPTNLQISKFLGLATISQFQSCGPIPVFPTLPQGFPVKAKPTFKTTVVSSSSGREVRGANQTISALWDIELLFEELRDQTQNQTANSYFAGFTQFMQLCQLWLSMYGQMGLFYFDAPWDNSRTLQTIGTGDGQTVQFTAFRTWGIGSAHLTEPVGGINAISEVRLNNVVQNPSTYGFAGSRLIFTTPPPVGAVITMSFTYFYLCRFREDKLEFEEFSQDRWMVKSLKFRSVYWPYFGPN